MKLIGVEPGGQAWKEDLDQTGDVVGEPRTPPVVRNLRIDSKSYGASMLPRGTAVRTIKFQD